MNTILLNILIGFFLMPALLFFFSGHLGNYREKKDLPQLPPNKVSLLILLCSLASCLIAVFNIITYLMRQ